MKAISYRHSWGSDLSEEQEMEQLFGERLVVFGDAEPYTVEEALLFKKDDEYNLLEANGCSCWDGDYDGWSFSYDELIAWAEAKSARQEYKWRRQNFELLADWILKKVKDQ